MNKQLTLERDMLREGTDAKDTAIQLMKQEIEKLTKSNQEMQADI